MMQTTFSNRERFQIQASLNAEFREMLLAVPLALSTWYQRAQQRHDLANLSSFPLEDLGITEAQRSAEVSKPFWRTQPWRR